MNNKSINYFLFIFIFILNYILLDFFLIRIESLKFIDNNIFSPDAWVNHINALKLNNSTSFYEFYSLAKQYYEKFYNIYPIVLSLIYRLTSDINFIILFNTILLTLTSLKFSKIIEFIFNKNYFYIPVIFIIFNPIIILSTVQPLKEILVIYFSACLLLELVKFNKRNYQNYISIFFYFGCLFLFRFYQPLLILFSTGLFYIISNIYDKVKLKKLFDYSYAYIFFGIILATLIFNYFDLFNFFNQYRINDLKQNLINSNKFISINVDQYSSFLNLVINLPKLIFLSLLEPLPLISYDKNNIIFNIYIIYHIFYIILILGVLFLIFSENNKKLYFVLFVSIIPIVIFSFFITNLGTLVRIKSFYTILLLLLGLSGWLNIIFNKFYYKINLANLINHNKNILISILFSILTFIFLFLRDLFVINTIDFNIRSDFFYLITFMVTMSSYALTSPLYEIFNKHLINEDILSIKNIFIVSLSINILFSLFLFIFLYLIFDLNLLFDRSNYLFLFSILNIPIGVFIILGNVIISSKKDPIHVTFGGIIVPILCVIFILFFKLNIFFEIILGLIIGQLLNLIYIYFLIFNSHKLRIIINEIFFMKSKIFDKNYYEFLNSISLNFIIFLPFLISTLYFIRLGESYTSYWILFSKVIFTFFFFIIGFVNINFLSSLFIFKNIKLIDRSLFLNKTSLFFFNILILISIIILFIYIFFIEPFIDSELKSMFFDDVFKILLILPFFAYSLILIKINPFLVSKINLNYLLIFLLIIFINYLCSIFINDINFYLFSIFVSYLSIILFIKILTSNFNRYFFYWLLLNIILITVIFTFVNNYIYVILFINILFILSSDFFKAVVPGHK